MTDIDKNENCGIEISSYFFKDLSKYHVFTYEEQRELIKKAQSGCEKSKDLFLNSSMPLVVSIAKRYMDKGLPILDLIQEGFFGLLRAYEKFNFKLDYRFSTYATWWIRHTILRALANKTRNLRLPSHAHEELLHIIKTKESLDKMNNCTTTTDDIVRAIGNDKISVDRVNELLKADKEFLSIDYEYENKNGENSSLKNHLKLCSNNDTVKMTENAVIKDQIKIMFKSLSPREIDIIKSRFGLNGKEMSLKQLGKKYGLTRERIRQIEKKALRKIKRYANFHDLKLNDFI